MTALSVVEVRGQAEERLARVQPRALSTEQLSQAWGVSVPHVKDLIREGRIRVFRVGRRVLIPISEVERIEAGEQV